MDYLNQLVAAFGPVGAAFALVAIGIGYFYRRDILGKVQLERRALADKNNEVIAKLTTVLERLETLLRDSETARQLHTDALLSTQDDVRSLLQVFMRVEARRRPDSL